MIHCIMRSVRQYTGFVDLHCVSFNKTAGFRQRILSCNTTPNRALFWLRVIWPSRASNILVNSSPTHFAVFRCESLILDSYSAKRSCFTSFNSTLNDSLSSGIDSDSGVLWDGSVDRRGSDCLNLSSSLSHFSGPAGFNQRLGPTYSR